MNIINGISAIKGETLLNVDIDYKNNEIIFVCASGKKYLMVHSQDCCESVYIDDIVGDINDLVGSPLIMAEEAICDLPAKNEYDDSYTWTFYKLATIKGYVNIKWYGTSNGYYSESVDFIKLTS